jgi:hypothetical protein
MKIRVRSFGTDSETVLFAAPRGTVIQYGAKLACRVVSLCLTKRVP